MIVIDIIICNRHFYIKYIIKIKNISKGLMLYWTCSAGYVARVKFMVLIKEKKTREKEFAFFEDTHSQSVLTIFARRMSRDCLLHH